MHRKFTRGRLMTSSILAGTIAFAAPAFAQTSTTAPTAPAASNPGPDTPAPTSVDGSSGTTSGGAQEIIVTGSRIPHPELTSASPVTIVGAAEVRQTGTTRVEDLLNQLPQVFADQGSNISNGATGTAEVDLRGLGTSRTLTLINGRRVVPGNPDTNDSAADLNLIPAQLIKNVQVLTGGASSVYGADAVAGVVNFVLDTNFSGFKLDGQYSLYPHTNGTNGAVTSALAAQGFNNPHGDTANGGTVEATAVMGAGFDDNRGHVTAYFTYRRVSPVTEAERDYSACALAAQPVAKGGGFTCGGSPTAFPANIYRGANGNYYHVAGNQLQPGGLLYNYAPTNYFQRNDERYTAGFFAHYDVSDAVKPYMEFMFMDDDSTAQIAPSGNFFNTTTINCDNPLLSAQQLGIICNPAFTEVGADGVTRATGTYIARRNVEGGGRQDVLRHTTYRGVIGMKGDFAKGLSYDAYYQYGRVTSSDQQANQLSIQKLTNALDVVLINGVPSCRSAAARTAGCVPYNIFQDGGVTQAALNYLGIPTFSAGQNTEQVADASITLVGGEYGLTSPYATEGLGLNFGVEYRKETNRQNYDVSFSSGDIAGAGSAPQPISGAFDVKEAFVEASLPLVQDKPFFQLLSVSGGYRRSHYDILGTSSSFNTDTYKGEVIYAPVRDIKFRGSYNRAVRAPNVGELFLAQQVALDGSIDPCGTTKDADGNTLAPSATQAQCALTGLTAAQYGVVAANPAQQYNGLLGGNPNLKPEVSDSYSAGVVLTPTFLRGFNMTLDAFQIKVKNDIGRIGADTIITQCINTGNPGFCNLIHRDANGSLFRTNAGYIQDTQLNQGSVKTRGVDVTLGYTQSLGGYGSLGLSGVGTYLDKLTYSPTPGVSYNCAGLYGVQCGTPNPKWRSRLRATYTAPQGPSLSLQWRYFAHVKDDALSSDPDLAPTDAASAAKNKGLYPLNSHIKSQSYFDLAFTAPVGDKFTLRIGANDILDKDPPINALGLGTVENGNTFAQVYDALGRYVYVGFTLSL